MRWSLILWVFFLLQINDCEVCARKRSTTQPWNKNVWMWVPVLLSAGQVNLLAISVSPFLHLQRWSQNPTLQNHDKDKIRSKTEKWFIYSKHSKAVNNYHPLNVLENAPTKYSTLITSKRPEYILLLWNQQIPLDTWCSAALIQNLSEIEKQCHLTSQGEKMDGLRWESQYQQPEGSVVQCFLHRKLIATGPGQDDIGWSMNFLLYVILNRILI